MMRRLSALLALVLVLAACSSSGEPTGFDQQPVEVGDELGAALGVPADEIVPVVERNFLEGCVLWGVPRIDGDADNSPEACSCAYAAIQVFYEERARDAGAIDVGAEAYSLFKALDNDLKDNARPLPADVANAVDEAGCTA